MTKETYLNVIDTLGSLIVNTVFEGHVFSVGGCERDRLMGREIKDIDLVCDLPNGGINLAKYLELRGLTKGSVVTYEHFGTAMFHLKMFPDIELEAVQTRSECYHDMESRNPDTAFGTIHDDCTRRDFTYNAIYHNVNTGEVCDFNGRSLEDLEANILRTCGDPDIIFTEDPLRILRAVRFASRFGSTIEEKTFEGMKKYVDRLSIISRERIAAEFDKMLTCDGVAFALSTLWKIGAMKYIVEEYADMKPRARKQLYKRLKFGCTCDYKTKLAIFLYNAVNPEKVMRELKYSNDIVNDVMFIINQRDFLSTKNADFTPSVRHLQYMCKTPEMFRRVAMAYCCATTRHIEDGSVLYETEWETKSKHLIKDKSDMFGYKLPINGEDVMRELGIGPSTTVKIVLNSFIICAYSNPKATTREWCISELKKMK